MPFEATYGFLLTLGLMAGVITLAARLQRRQAKENAVRSLMGSEGVRA
jgi:hypothetical protein